jgi:ribosomal protein RSM22 (predicted rRNA methylase)
MYFSIDPVYDRRGTTRRTCPIVSEDDHPMHLPEAFAAAIEAAASRIPGRDLTRAADTLSARYREPDSASPAGTGAGAGAGAQAGASAAVSSLTNAGLDRPLTDAERAAYLVVRAPATFAAVTAVLAELRDRRPELTVRRVLDLGAGPGVASWAALNVFDEVNDLRLVERDRGFAALGREILDAAAPGVKAITWKQADLREWVRGDRGGDAAEQVAPAAFDLVLISYALGELMADVRARVLDAAWRATSAGGALVIVEPGTPRHFQGVIAARTWLLAQGATIAAPCPHAAACPMAEADDWCHFSARVPRTREHRRLKGGSLSYEDEKFSYLIASRSTQMPTSSRIVRHPYVEKGRITLTRCATDGTIATTPIGRNDREAFRRARKARWGDAY